MTPKDEDVYEKLLEIAQEQAASSGATTELHRQNLSRLDAMSNLLSAQTATLVGISNAINIINDTQKRSDVDAEKGRTVAVDVLKNHITQEFNVRFSNLEFWRKPAFWLAIALLALSNLADALPKFIGLFK